MTEEQVPKDFSAEQLPEILPILPLFDTALFPKMVLPLVVMQSESIQLIDEAMSGNRIIGLLVSKDKSEQIPHPLEGLATIGTSALILKMAKADDQRAQMLVQGLSRFTVSEFIEGQQYLRARVNHRVEKEPSDKETEALMSNLAALFGKIIELSPGLPQEMADMAKSMQEPGMLADMVASTMNTTAEEKQKVLELFDVKNRLKEVSRLANHQLEILELGNKIQSQVKGDMEKSQREYYLRQQLKAIKEELGEKDDTNVEIEEYRAKIEQAKLPEEALQEAERELDRLSRMHPSSAE